MPKDKSNHEEATVMVCYGWVSENRGDQSITLGMDELLSNTSEDIEYQILSSSLDENSVCNARLENNYFKEYKQYLARKYKNYPLRKFFTAIELLLLILLPGIYKRIVSGKPSSLLEEIYSADLILYNAGHLFLSPKDMTSYQILQEDFETVLPGILARRLDIPYGLWGQSVGPIEGSGLIVDKYVLRGAEFVYCRESESIESLQSLGVDKENIAVVPDPAFALSYDETDENPLSEYDISEDYICLTVRRSGARRGVNIPDEEYHHYLNQLAKFVNRWYKKTDIDVVFVSQHGSSPGYSDRKLADSTVAEDLQLRIDDKNEIVMVNDDLSIDELKQVYANSAGLIGTRFHSLIFALQVGTPVIGLSSRYTGPKIRGLMKDLDMEERHFIMDELDGDDLYGMSRECFEGDNTSVEPAIAELREESKKEMRTVIGNIGSW